MQPVKGVSLTVKIAISVCALILISTTVIGVFSYALHRGAAIDANAERAVDIAGSVAAAVDPSVFRQAMDTGVKTPEWEDYKRFLDSVKRDTGVIYLYVLDSRYSDVVYYYCEGNLPGEEDGIDLGDTETVEVHADELFQTLRTGGESTTEFYDSEGFGTMVSGFSPIFDETGAVIGVVGADVSLDEVMETSHAFMLKLILIVLGTSILFGLFCFWLLRRLVGAPIKSLSQAAGHIARGDLSIQLMSRSNNEIGRLFDEFKAMVEATKKQIAVFEEIAEGDLTVKVEPRCDQDAMSFAMRKMIGNLQHIFSGIRDGSEQVALGARQIAGGAQTLAQGSTEQAATMEELSRAISGISDKTRDNAGMAEKATALAAVIRQRAETGSRQMDRMLQAVTDINSASQSIGKVIEVIDSIAFQTNILALNAAVEAARAGQHGKGFAVVADEVRSLAAKSAEAAKNTSQLIEDSIEKAELGALIAKETADSLSEIVTGVNESTKIIAEIASASEDQTIAVSQVNKGIEQVSIVVHQTSATAEESASSCSEICGQSDHLLSMLSQFRLEEARPGQQRLELPPGAMSGRTPRG